MLLYIHYATSLLYVVTTECNTVCMEQGTNEILRIFISLTCFQHAGLQLREMVKSVSLGRILT